MSDKAAEELAKLGQKALETSEKAGGWVDNVFGKGLQHLGSAFDDSMAAFRVRNRHRVLEKTRKAIEQSGLKGDIRSLDPRISVPLLEAMEMESDETIQDVWAAYIRNSVDPRMPNPDRLLIDVIKRLEPIDWPVLRKVFDGEPGKELAKSDFGLGDDALRVSLDRMETVGLFDYDDDDAVYLVDTLSSRKHLVIRFGNATYIATRLLHRLAAATAIQGSQTDESIA